MLEQNAFLQGRQRIDVLNIGRAARDGSDNAVDLRCVSGTRGSISGVMALQSAAMRLAGTADCEAAKRPPPIRPPSGVVNNARTSTGQALLPQPLDERDRQKRMAAEFEEIVVTPDAVELAAVRPTERRFSLLWVLREPQRCVWKMPNDLVRATLCDLIFHSPKWAAERVR